MGGRIYTIEEYLAKDESTHERYEFWNEDIVKLEEISYFKKSILNLERALFEKLRETKYRIFSNFFLKKKKLWIETENCLFYPDLFVVDSEKTDSYKNREDIFSNPVMIVEVSTIESTARDRDQTFVRDRAAKFWKYQKIPSLEEYVLITDMFSGIVIETYNRLDERYWKYRSYFNGNKDVVRFESVELNLPITEFYL